MASPLTQGGALEREHPVLLAIGWLGNLTSIEIMGADHSSNDVPTCSKARGEAAVGHRVVLKARVDDRGGVGRGGGESEGGGEGQSSAFAEFHCVGCCVRIDSDESRICASNY